MGGMWFGKCSGKQERHIKIRRDMWWFLNDFGIGKPPSFSSRNSVDYRPIVKNLGRFLWSQCDNRQSKILCLGETQTSTFQRIKDILCKMRGFEDVQIDSWSNWMFFNVARSHPFQFPRLIPLGTSLFKWKDLGVPTDWNFKEDCYLLYPQKKVPKDLRYFKNYVLLNLWKLCKLKMADVGRSREPNLLQLSNVALPFWGTPSLQTQSVSKNHGSNISEGWFEILTPLERFQKDFFKGQRKSSENKIRNASKELMFASWLNDLSGRLRVLRQEQLRVIQVCCGADGWSPVRAWNILKSVNCRNIFSIFFAKSTIKFIVANCGGEIMILDWTTTLLHDMGGGSGVFSWGLVDLQQKTQPTRNHNQRPETRSERSSVFQPM